jgi:hypothetical protein
MNSVFSDFPVFTRRTPLNAQTNIPRLVGELRERTGLTQKKFAEAIEKRLWTAADTLWANSAYASNEYFFPVMVLVF